jgi:hypothetical protein
MRRIRLTARCFVACLILFSCLLATPLAAQVNNAVIDAQAVDTDGAPLPGVVVTAIQEDRGVSRTAVTNENGLARLAALPPGAYRVTFELPGLQTVRETVEVRVGQTARIEATMAVAASEEITVSAEAPMVDVFKTDSSTNIVPEQIETLPVPDRDFQRLAFIAPGVQRERGDFRFIQGGPVIGAGGNASQATILVDGVDFTDPTLGLSRVRFSQDAIQEFRVLTNRFDTEIGGSAGGGLSIVTKSGTNAFAGRVFAFYRDDSLREPGELEQDDLPFSREQYGFTLGGPIARDRTHWFASYEHINEDNVTLFRPQGAFAGRADDVPLTFDQDLVFASLNHQLSDSQSLAARVTYEDFEQENFRVGGVAAPEYGQQLLRENWNVGLEHVAVLSGTSLNEARLQYGEREFFEPTNSDAVSEWFTNGTTLQTGANILSDLLGDGSVLEFKDTYHWSRGAHDFKVGGSVQEAEDRSIIDTFDNGLFLYLTDTRAFPFAYLFGVGSSDVTLDTTRYGAFVHDDWRVRPDLTVSLGVRYDLDTDGNNPDFTHPLFPEERDRDDDNFQPRVGFSWDLSGDGVSVLRGGAGIFTGRYLLIPATIERQQNDLTGRVGFTRLNGALLGLPAFALDVNDPMNTGLPLAPDIGLIGGQLDAPESRQATLGWTHRLGGTGLFFDAEGIYVEGDDEIVIRDTNFGGNANPVRLTPLYNQVNTYTNEGRSLYKALVLSVNGTIPGGHLLQASATFSDKKNVSDDFSPQFPFGYPNDPANIDAEYGRSRSDEPFRFVASAIFRLPYRFTLAPILEYGEGQPFNRRVGVDVNGDGKNSDRLPGVGRNSEDGPEFRQISLRVTRPFSLGDRGELEAIVEVFNLTDETNFVVGSVDGAEFLSYPTFANPAAATIANPNFGEYSATFPGREVQLGLRWRF